MTYTERILSDLAAGGWVCGSEWYAQMMPTFAQRISELNRDEPGRIESRVCREHRHRSTIHQYRDRTRVTGDTLWLRSVWTSLEDSGTGSAIKPTLRREIARLRGVA
mgnify:CR=1 FL=1